jgi:hypothetical protein
MLSIHKNYGYDCLIQSNNSDDFTAEDAEGAEDTEESLILVKGTVAMKAIKALTQGFTERPIMAAPQGYTGEYF